MDPVCAQSCGETNLCFLFYSRAGRRRATRQRKAQQHTQPARVKAERNALANKEEAPPPKKRRMYVMKVWGWEGGYKCSIGKDLHIVRGFLQEGYEEVTET